MRVYQRGGNVLIVGMVPWGVYYILNGVYVSRPVALATLRYIKGGSC